MSHLDGATSEHFIAENSAPMSTCTEASAQPLPNEGCGSVKVSQSWLDSDRPTTEKSEMPGSGASDQPIAATTPEERLESLRFFVAEGQPELPKSLLDWMQEVEAQIEGLRGWLRTLPKTYAKKGPVW